MLCIESPKLRVEIKEKGAELCTDPQKLDQKSNDWRSVFLWLNTLLN